MSEVTTTKLSQDDRSLLLALDFHGRDSYNKLAERLQGTPESMRDRIDNLVQQGVVKGFHPIINVPKLGYYSCRLLVTLHNYTREDKEDIIDFLINHSKVFWLFDLQGEYDLLIDLWCQDLAEFKDFTAELEDKFGRFMKRKSESVVTRFTYLQTRYLTGDSSSEELELEGANGVYELSKLEERLLKLLCVNARFSNEELALNLHAEPEDIRKAIAKLEDKGIIAGYRPLIDHLQIGYTWYKLWINTSRTSASSYKELIEYLKEQPITLWLIDGVGLLGDVEMEVMVHSTSELVEFIDQMRVRFPTLIEEYRFLLFTETLKELYLPFH